MKDGFLHVDEIFLKVPELRSYTLEDIQHVVKSNEKQRFALEQEDNGHWKIRANQAHSIQVRFPTVAKNDYKNVKVDELDLQPIKSANEISTVIHGTYYKSWEMIQKTGLRRMNRNHIHFAAGLPGQGGVISGMRSSCEVIIYLNLKKALEDGIPFFRSANNVILSPGNKDGIIFPRYFEGVQDRVQNCRMQFNEKINSGIKAGPAETGRKRKNKKKKKEKKNEGQDDGPDASDEDTQPSLETGHDESPSKYDEPRTIGKANDTQPNAQTKGEDVTVTPAMDQPNGAQQDIQMKSKDVSVKPTTSKANDVQPDAPAKSDDDAKAASASNTPAETMVWKEPVMVTEAATSRTIVKDVIRQNPSHMVVVCCGEKFGNEDSKVRLIAVFEKPNIMVYYLDDDNREIVREGELNTLLNTRLIPKVFHNIRDVSMSLMMEFGILLDGTPIWDIKVPIACPFITARGKT
ncbi:uncharacterized protein LOC128208509 [Mya arenaria]|uniref:uncharacterized protein LOC128208509 n=1 Tax=Mya arenaria TaxID=6604 RepID=UPI0022E43800|nr:uncharacterized protein LOC128208509 [Mya arenaria]